MRSRYTRGFTMVELVIVVLVIGILSAIAYPAFQESIQKSRRSDGKTALLAIQLEQEKFRANCTSYATDLDGAGTCISAALTYPTTSPDSFYNLSITAANATSYTLNAAATGHQSGDSDCTPMTLVVNTNAVDVTGPADCW